MMISPKISILVCTRNRGIYLLNTLQAYEKISTNIDWELIVVNNGSTDSTPQILHTFASNTSINIRLILEQRVGVSRAKNTGLQHAVGDIIVFSDDDCYPKSDFVDAVWSNFSETQLDYLGARVLLYDPADLPITIQVSEDRRSFPPGSFIEPGLIHGANMAFRRKVFLEVGGFDELLGPGTNIPGGEEMDFINRVSATGFFGAYDPRPVVFHHHRRQTQEQAKTLMRSYDIGRGARYMKAILDPRQRNQACRDWYWRTVLPSLHSQRAAQKFFYETVGAIRYLTSRIKNCMP